MSFTDADLTDTHMVSVQPVGTTLGTLTALVSTDTSNGVGGQVSWTYTVADSATDYLAAGQTKVEHFTVTVSDGHGGTTSQDVAVTITGTDEAPVITAHSDGAVTEDATSPNLTSTGTVSFTDADLTDTHMVSVQPVGTTLRTLTALVSTDTSNGGVARSAGPTRSLTAPPTIWRPARPRSSISRSPSPTVMAAPRRRTSR